MRLSEQAQVAGPLVKELAEPLHVVRAGKGRATFPACDHHIIGSANTLRDHFLRPPPFQACVAQEVIGDGLRGFLDHISSLSFQHGAHDGDTFHEMALTAHGRRSPLKIAIFIGGGERLFMDDSFEDTSENEERPWPGMRNTLFTCPQSDLSAHNHTKVYHTSLPNRCGKAPVIHAGGPIWGMIRANESAVPYLGLG
jgi:hypothetical protein